jgi:glycosyltransferase involved in cell wall biosynthesis
LERESISHLLSRSKILVLPSRRESFGIVLLEGAHAGCAIVATATGGIPSIIMNGENGLLFDVDSDPQLAQHLTDLLLNEKLRLGLISDFYKVLPHYDVGNFVSKYESVFTSVVKQ